MFLPDTVCHCFLICPTASSFSQNFFIRLSRLCHIIKPVLSIEIVKSQGLKPPFHYAALATIWQIFQVRQDWVKIEPIWTQYDVRTLYLRLTRAWYALIMILGKWIYDVWHWSYAPEWYNYAVNAMLPLLSDLCMQHLCSKRPIRYNHAVPPFWLLKRCPMSL